MERLTAASEGGFCGQTHLHKAAFVAQEFLGVPFGLRWEIYRYGPFSREIRPVLAACEKKGTVAIQDHPRGPRVIRPPDAPPSRVSTEFQAKLQLLSERLAPMTRPQLEKVATAAWVTRSNPHVKSIELRAQEMHRLKPHIDVHTGLRVVRYLDDLLAEINRRSPGAPWPEPELMRRLAEKTRELYPPGSSLGVYRPSMY
ncbi:MAG: hypothetical protein ACTHNP_13440 [Solirubrobacterales bacterium]